MSKNERAPEAQSLWYKDAVLYQIHVKSFCDGNGDGIGDLKGLTQRLDYLQELGISALWLLPFYPSPLRDDGYDIADYFGINPSFGTLRDFKALLREAHERGLRIITELVLNHTSDQHEWFQQSRRAAPQSPWRDFYVWSSTPDKYADARIIFKDFESSNWTWDPVAQAYYWHRFYSHQPDLNFENPRVHEALLKVIDHWMKMGVDGMRLDAVPYLYEQEGTNCENLPATHAFLKKLRAHVDTRYSNRMLLAEANQWPEDAVRYFGDNDECHMAFHFPLMPRMFMALQMEDYFPIVDILEQTPPLPSAAQWAIFLRNHDELTLEMVTDEERDYMYRFYAHDPVSRINLGIRRRLAPLLHNSRRRMEIMNILLFSLPGTPVVYYGDELGMGDNHYLGDRDGVRTPMQWSADRNAGFSTANPQKLLLPIIIDPEYHYETINVETQERNFSSMLWWTKRVLSMRKKYRAFARGSIEFLHPENSNILAFVRTYGDESILVVVNLSRFAQVAELDLSAYRGRVPEDMFGGTAFPPISDGPYLLTMGFHDYFWLLLRKPLTHENLETEHDAPEVHVREDWTELFSGKYLEMLESDILPSYLARRVSCGCRSHSIRRVEVAECIPVHESLITARILLVRVFYGAGTPDLILLPLCCSSPRTVKSAVLGNMGLVMLRVRGASNGYVHDASYHREIHALFAKTILNRRKLAGTAGFIEGMSDRQGRKSSAIRAFEKVQLLKAGRRNTSLAYDREVYCKLYRRLESGPNPELELIQYLSATQRAVPLVPTFLGALHYRAATGEVFTLGMCTSYVKNIGPAWQFCLDAVAKYYESVLAQRPDPAIITSDLTDIFGLSPHTALPELVATLVGTYLPSSQLLGQRTGEFHRALVANHAGPDFAPEPYSMLYQRSLYQSMRSQAKRVLALLRKRVSRLDESVRGEAEAALGTEKRLLEILEGLLKRKMVSTKMRIHGDYHLGQILSIGNDIVIKDLEGTPETALGERRLKRSPLRDVASMLNSFYRAAHVSLHDKLRAGPDLAAQLQVWADVWTAAVSKTFLAAYLNEIAGTGIVDETVDDFFILLRLFMLDRTLWELGTALGNNDPTAGIYVRAYRKYLAMDVRARGQ